MKQVNELTTYTHEVKQSKFIAYLTPYTQYKQTLIRLKEEHPKARHFVVALRYLNELEQIVEYSTDDGEPKGTSGKPTLFVLQGKEMINTAVIIVRYFGGTKLGTGGLVRAYSDTTNLVLQDAVISEYLHLVEEKISFEYSDIRMLDYECVKNNIEILTKDFESKTLYTLRASRDDMTVFLKKLQRVVSIV